MVIVLRAMCVASAILCLPTVAAAELGLPSRDESHHAVSTELSRAANDANDDRGAAIDGKPFVVTVAARKAARSPSALRQRGTVSRRRDTLWNGVLVGAGVGALLGALGGQALIDCSECAGFNVPLTFGVLGAGVGAGVGAGIDALRHTRSPIPNTPGRVTVTPLLGKGQRAVVALVRF
jgi:hypothetical protein